MDLDEKQHHAVRIFNQLRVVTKLMDEGVKNGLVIELPVWEQIVDHRVPATREVKLTDFRIYINPLEDV
jgi:hypothetical protein